MKNECKNNHKKFILHEKCFFFHIIRPAFYQDSDFSKKSYFTKKSHFCKNVSKRPKKSPFTTNIFWNSLFFIFFPKKIHFSGRISTLLEIPQKVIFQEQPRNLLFYKACGKRWNARHENSTILTKVLYCHKKLLKTSWKTFFSVYIQTITRQSPSALFATLKRTGAKEMSDVKSRVTGVKI